MNTGKISFGNIFVVAAKPSKMKQIDRKLASSKELRNSSSRNVTSIYKKYTPSGKIAKAAQTGSQIKLYVTGEDYIKMKNKEQGWDTTEGLLSEMNSFYDASKLSSSQIAREIIKNA